MTKDILLKKSPSGSDLNIMEKRLFQVGLVAAALILGVFALPLFLGWVYIYDDLGPFHLPLRFFYARSLAAGDNFTWFPNLFCGFYLHGEGQVGMYHPLHLLLYSTLPLTIAFNLELLPSYPFMLVGMFLFLQRWSIRRDAAMFGALVFAFSSCNVLRHVHLNAVAIIAHIPWLLFAIEGIMCGSSHKSVAFAKLSIMLLTASQLLLGYPQYVWFSSLIELLYLLFRAPAWQTRGRLLFLGEAKLLGVLVGSIQLLPTWDVLSNAISVRQDPSLAFRYFGSLEWHNLVLLVAPYLTNSRVFGGPNLHELGLYNGALATVLPLWLLMRRKALGAMRPVAMGTLALATLGIILALGQDGYLYRLLTHLPLVGLFRLPSRYILLVHLAMAVATAIAFSDLSDLARGCEQPVWRQLWPLGLCLVASIIVAGLALWRNAQPASTYRFASTFYVLLGPILMTVATALVVAASRGVPYALVGIILFAAADQAVYGLSYVWKTPPIDITSFVEAQPMPPEVAQHRIMSMRRWDDGGGNILTMKHFRLASGYAALPPKKELDYRQRVALQVAGVQWHQEQGEKSWSQVPDPMPRARLVSRALESTHPQDDINTVEPKTTALVSEALELASEPAGMAVITSDRPGEIKVVTTADSRQLLVLSESYHEGWQVQVDGETRRILRVYGDFMGSVVEEGRHEVEFRFQPSSLHLGKWLATLGLGLMLLSCLLHYALGRTFTHTG